MSAEKPHRENTGVLFRNRRKVRGDNRPEWTGEAMIAGERYYVASWTKQASNGDEYQYRTLAFTNANKPKEESEETNG